MSIQLNTAVRQLPDWLNTSTPAPVAFIRLSAPGLDLAGLTTSKERLWLWTNYLDAAHRLALHRLMTNSTQKLTR